MLFGKFLSNFIALFILFAVFQEPALAIKKSYIVYLGAHSHGPEATSADIDRVTASHTQLLSSFLGSEEKARDALIYSYERHINGFAAFLEEEEAAEIANQAGVVSVFLNQGKKLHTTHSWDFLMLGKDGNIQSSSSWEKARFGEDTIIANLDTGVWPESKSFSGKGYGPIPSKWKGICQFNESAGPLCNRKLIGARYFNKGMEAFLGKVYPSTHTPRDDEGHGSHTLSTAGGNMVEGASVFGIGNGTAKGGSPKARVAAYRVCYSPVNGSQCFDADILKAYDAAVGDGVDVISFSVGGDPSDYMIDGIAIGSFHAVRNGIVVVASAGNEGPAPGTVTNVAPWIFTVGASTTDRRFEANVQLKNGSLLPGMSLSSALPDGGFYSLINAGEAAAANVSGNDALLCKNKTLDSEKVKGKIVVCLRGDNARVEKGIEVARAGGAAMILCNDEKDGNDLLADAHFLPATQINYNDGLILFSFLNSTKNPQGLITPPRAVFDVKPAPSMAAFSSRGPNIITPQILKPDITAPGVNIIAAYSEAVSPTGVPVDKRTTPYYVASGTSMSCPHVSGVVGLLKTLHPDWSPAAIKSAIMTSSRTRDNTAHPMRDQRSSPATAFDRSAGHIRPNRAMDPGLVYDMGPNDYLDFLCGIGYNQSAIALFAGDAHYECPKNYSILNMNYPSISVPNLSESVTVKRKLKNVGRPGSYACRIKQAPFFRISVEPMMLKFDKIGEEKSFEVTIRSKGSNSGYEFGGVTWTDGIHFVRTPIAVANINAE
ncbi:Subtilase family protein [Perilla frutescens var. hirtella]|uniref:Subtilase family protein n=1 Tax=Perilla frutescens var. hirtella TaxID=608512 RepID=A0AAD4JGW1_PERFH|nr:Subtilase family protein [Perilla frutescens var. hirtella]